MGISNEELLRVVKGLLSDQYDKIKDLFAGGVVGPSLDDDFSTSEPDENGLVRIGYVESLYRQLVAKGGIYATAALTMPRLFIWANLPHVMTNWELLKQISFNSFERRGHLGGLGKFKNKAWTPYDVFTKSEAEKDPFFRSHSMLREIRTPIPNAYCGYEGWSEKENRNIMGAWVREEDGQIEFNPAWDADYSAKKAAEFCADRVVAELSRLGASPSGVHFSPFDPAD